MNQLTAPRTHLLTGGALALLIGLAGCNGNSSDSATVAVAGDVPIAYAKRSTTLSINPTDGTPTAPGGDLMIREKSSPSAPEHNVTALFTQGVGDVSDPEVSFDGKKIIFAMRCPTANTAKVGDQPACTGRWNIWEYDMTSGGFTGGSFKRLTASAESDDVDPAYLPAGRGVVFSSNRQTATRNSQALGQAYFALDEYERERVLNLHTMTADGGAITQISVNQSHDRNPVVRTNGDMNLAEGWDLTSSDWLADGRAGTLTLRAGGNLTLSSYLGAPNDSLIDGETWNLRLVGGADLTAANPLATRAVDAGGLGSVLLNGNSAKLRTGTGSIEVAAATDFKGGGNRNGFSFANSLKCSELLH